ncbi:MAG: 4Fe-4S dicluster domain-containing protein [Anaeromyxobacteraceae bacterium]
MTGRRRIRSYRRLAEVAQALIALTLPFVTIRGESALRFDVRSLTLHFFGASILMDEFFVVLVAALFGTFAFLLVTVLFGRVWCGWGCPQTALVDLTGWFARARKRGGGALWVGHAGVGLASAVVAANLIWYFVPPREFFARLAHLSLGPTIGGTWAVLGLVIYLDLALLRQTFCATTCPYAKLQGVLLDRHSLVVAYDTGRDDCIECGACVRACPVGIDIRDGLQAACVACGECIDACTPIMRKRKRPPDLVGYSFGAPGTPRRLLRPITIGLGAASAAALLLLAVTVSRRDVVEVTVSAASGFAPRRTADGHAYNAYDVAFENRGRAPLGVHLRLVGLSDVTLRPAEVELAAGEHRRVRVLAVAKVGSHAAGTVPLQLAVSAGNVDGLRTSRAISFVVPTQLGGP